MSISFRVWLPVAVIFSLLMAFGSSVYLAFSQQAGFHQSEAANREGFRLANDLLFQLKDAETSQRSYLLTGEESYLQPYNAAKERIPETLQSLKTQAGADPVLVQQSQTYAGIVSDIMAEQDESLQAYRTNGLDAAVRILRKDRGQAIMERAQALTLEISDAYTRRLLQATEQEDRLGRGIKGLIIFGSPAIACLALIGFFLATRRIVRAVRDLESGVSALGMGKQVASLDIPGNDELSRLAASFNGMAARLSAARFAQDRAEGQLRENNQSLIARGSQLERRTQALDLLGRIAHRLPGCSDEAEFGELIERYVSQLFPEIPGALYLLNPSHTLLRRMAVWNGPKAGLEEFQPGDCWSLRRGQQHINLDFGKEVICKHVDPKQTDGYMCWPLVAQNETVGLLYVEHVIGAPHILDDRALQDINVLCETIALALVNLRLRDTLRNQSIRDALTGLFNRRYLEESLEIEFSRAERSKHSIAIIMIDVDHFKQFNDTFGHAAGDLVLKHVGQTIHASIRKGDVACRYGGEEFMLVLVGASVDAAKYRAEQVRTAVKALTLDYNGQQLGTLTVSLGVSVYPDAGSDAVSVIGAADAALYEAKRKGRDQVCLYARAKNNAEAAE